MKSIDPLETGIVSRKKVRLVPFFVRLSSETQGRETKNAANTVRGVLSDIW